MQEDGMRIEEYLTKEGKSPFESWFLKLDARAAAKVTTALARLAGGNPTLKNFIGILKACSTTEHLNLKICHH